MIHKRIYDLTPQPPSLRGKGEKDFLLHFKKGMRARLTPLLVPRPPRAVDSPRTRGQGGRGRGRGLLPSPFTGEGWGWGLLLICLITVIRCESYSADTYRYFPPQELRFKDYDESQFYPDRLYPIGWSKNGVFAYIEESLEDAAGFVKYTLVLQDMVSDSVVWSHVVRLEEEYYENYSERKGIKVVWAQNAELFSRELRKQGISQAAKFELSSFPIRVRDDSIDVQLEHIQQEIEDPESYSGRFLIPTEVRMKIHSQRLGEKQVYSSTFGYDVAMSVEGYLKSPFEERIAVILSYESPGHHGPPDYVNYVLVGAHLEKGFSKKSTVGGSPDR
jgi:predicted secreted protein